MVGDWVALDPAEDPQPTIRAVLPRRTKFSRRAAHEPGSDDVREQVVAANVDVVFIVAAISEQVSRGLLERYLTLAWESGAQPVLLLTKTDLVADVEDDSRRAGGARDSRARRVGSHESGSRGRPRSTSTLE